jgi:hypothetical protein
VKRSAGRSRRPLKVACSGRPSVDRVGWSRAARFT